MRSGPAAAEAAAAGAQTTARHRRRSHHPRGRRRSGIIDPGTWFVRAQAGVARVTDRLAIIGNHRIALEIIPEERGSDAAAPAMMDGIALAALVVVDAVAFLVDADGGVAIGND